MRDPVPPAYRGSRFHGFSMNVSRRTGFLWRAAGRSQDFIPSGLRNADASGNPTVDYSASGSSFRSGRQRWSRFLWNSHFGNVFSRRCANFAAINASGTGSSRPSTAIQVG